MTLAQSDVAGVTTANPRIRSGRAAPIMRFAEWLLAVVFTCLLIVIHVTNRSHAGALWRDEATTVNIAEAATFDRFLEMRIHDSYPSFWLLVLRGWVSCGFESDIALRSLGLILGLTIIALLWWFAMIATRSPPLSALLLVAANPIVMHYGDSLRAYGCGMALDLLTFGLAWHLIQRPRWRLAGLVALVACLCVNTLYQNPFLLLAICVAATAVELLHRDGRRFLMFLMIGCVAAASLILAPRSHLFPDRDNVDNPLEMLNAHLTYPEIIVRLFRTLNVAGDYMAWVWVGLVVLSLVVFVGRAVTAYSGGARAEADRAVFFATALVAGVIMYAVVLMRVGIRPQPWHVLALLPFAGVIVDAGVQLAVERSLLARLIRLASCVALAAHLAGSNWRIAHERFTNVDVIAERLADKAKPDDLIIVNPVWTGITFARYYKGSTPWLTLPDIEDHLVHRNSQIREKMEEAAPLGPMFEKMTSTLQSGHKIWVVGGWGPMMNFPGAMNLGPAPHKVFGWNHGAYFSDWSSQLGDFIQLHARSVQEFAVKTPDPASGYERPQLLFLEGWR